jgi:hypothetical protein
MKAWLMKGILFFILLPSSLRLAFRLSEDHAASQLGMYGNRDCMNFGIRTIHLRTASFPSTLCLRRKSFRIVLMFAGTSLAVPEEVRTA